jgi:asparagine synthase (glutamine-hydrolysing)
MCGILGWCNFSGKKNIKILREISHNIKSRGPDAYGEFDSFELSFIHRRLSIIDLTEKANQPLKCNKTGNIITYNGEIYNFKEIKNEIEKNSNYNFITKSDTEVILAGYHIFGIEELLKKIDGMFAFAIWDISQKKLILARDKFGEKPLFYCNDSSGGLIFGSTFLSLFKNNEVRNISKFDNNSLVQYLNLNYLLSNKTFYQNIKQLSPASYLIFKQNKDISHITEKKYWYLENTVNQKKEKFTIDSAIEKFNYLLNKSVKSRLVSDVKPGCYLSGGVDSSLISLSMMDAEKNNFNTHNLSFNEKNFDESIYAKEINEKYKFKGFFHEIPKPKKISEDFKSIVEAMDQPMSDTSFISNFYLSKNSHKISKVVLSGDGGDELFGGYETYVASYIKNITNIIPNKITNSLNKFVFSKLKNNYESKIGFNYKIKKFFENINSKNEYSHILWRSSFNKFEINNFTNLEFKNYKDFLSNEIMSEFNKVKNCNMLDRNSFIDLKTWFPNDILYKLDRSSMFNSQESRLPFLHPEMINFAFQLPLKLKIRFFQKKILLKKVLIRRMNNKFVNRKKSGFNSPIGSWIAKDDNFRNLTHELLYSNTLNGLFKKNFIDKLLNNHINKKEDNTYKIFNIMVLSQWLSNNKITL